MFNKVLKFNGIFKSINKYFTESVSQRFKEKVIVVTGGSSGIGRATCLKAAKEGGRVVIADINEKGGQETLTEITELIKGNSIFVKTDTTKQEDAQNLVNESVKNYGKIDVLINCAATFNYEGFSATQEEWLKVFMVNQYGTTLITKSCIEELKKTEGCIVNVASVSGMIGLGNMHAYPASKAAINQLTKNFAVDLAPYKIRVNSVSPGYVITPSLEHYASLLGITLEQLLIPAKDKVLLGRAGKASEVANAIMFLASDEASYINGTNLVIDGGYTII